MRFIHLCLVALAVCRQECAEFNFRGCKSYDTGIANSEIHCVSSSSGCRVSCIGGQEFTTGDKNINIQCHYGQWQYRGSTTLPQCKDNCDIKSVFDGGFNCGHDANYQYSCKIYCAGERERSRHTCSQVTGLWSPPIKKCKSGQQRQQYAVNMKNGKCDNCDDSAWAGCETSEDKLTSAGLLTFSAIHCNSTNGCIVTCFRGYKLSTGGSEVRAQCSHGRWTYPGLTRQPKCLEKQERNYNLDGNNNLDGFKVWSGGMIWAHSICPQLGDTHYDTLEGCKEECSGRGEACTAFNFHEYHPGSGGSRCQLLKCPVPVPQPTWDYGQGWRAYSRHISGKGGDYYLDATGNCDTVLTAYGNRGGHYNCHGNNNQHRCELWCSNKEKSVTHVCNYSTDRWSPPIKNCY